MRTLLAAALLLAALVPVVPGVSAHHCAEPAPDQSNGAGITIPENPAGISGTLYPFVSTTEGVSVWVESGQEPGLQADNGKCRTSDGNQGGYGRDCQLVRVGLDATVSSDDEMCGTGLPTLP